MSCEILRKRCAAFTVLELLVVLAVIALIISLLLPAVQSARESSRKVQCANHIKQLSLAVMNFESQYGRLPSGGWGKNWAGISGIGTGPKQPGGWIYQVLPQLEKSNTFDLGGASSRFALLNSQRLQTPLSILHCPSRRRTRLYKNSYRWQPKLHSSVAKVARNDYAMNGGSVYIEYGAGPASFRDANSFRWPNMEKMTGLIHQRSRVRFSEVTDGLSQTYFIGEKHLPRKHYKDGADWGDNESAYGGDDRDTVRYTALSPQYLLRPMNDLSTYEPTLAHRGTRFGSAHTEGFQTSLADGSIHFISYSVDASVHMALGNRGDQISVDTSAL